MVERLRPSSVLCSILLAVAGYLACGDAVSGPAEGPAAGELSRLVSMLDGYGYSYRCQEIEVDGWPVRACSCDAENEVFFFSFSACLCSFDCETSSAVNGGRESPAAAVAILTREERGRSARELDAFADRLVAIATSYRSGDPPAEQRRAVAARQALVSAASSERGTPYAGAFERLVRIFEAARDPGMKHGTLWLVTRLPDKRRAFEFLGEVAASSDATAPVALHHITDYAENTGEPALTVLRRIWESYAAVDSTKWEGLFLLGKRYFGWER